MATLVLSAAGAAIGGSVGGSVLGLSMTAVGRFAGATLGRMIDHRVLGRGSEPVETRRIDRFRLSGAGEGAPIAQIFGRMRVGGHVIWASAFREHVSTSGGGGGKGAPRQPEVRRYSYSVSLAIALCEGEITGVNRAWADGGEIPVPDLNMRVYRGTVDQMPDPCIEAVEGVGEVPAYRGTAYVVIEDLPLGQFGNRVPQFSFEVTRPDLSDPEDPVHTVKGVALIPGSGEYALATKKVFVAGRDGTVAANVNAPSERPDIETSLVQLRDELPACGAVSLVVSWFGDDLRCGDCTIRPKFERVEAEAEDMPWSVAGATRTSAQQVPLQEGRPVYGGTPTDRSVVQAIRHAASQGLAVTYYPFILMDQMPGNGLPDPYGGAEQARLPWRGRITASLAPGQSGSPEGTAAADTEVAGFFGTASASDFTVNAEGIDYDGPDEWRFRRFILHQAALCAQAGGVSAFCIGSELRGLTTLRGASGFPVVQALRALAAECRAILGPEVKIGYAADWSEYFGYHPMDAPGDVYFHLDPLWSDAEIDFVGIDNYMPLSDWRDEEEHADVQWGAVHNADYLASNVAGGEGFDWFYASDADREVQQRTAITDEAEGEPWLWRYKDLRSWWENAHHERIGGIRQPTPTAWQPQGKPIWFTELGCPAVDKGTNQPNVFVDPKSSESSLPYASRGQRDDLIQRQYLRAMYRHWEDTAHNPVSPLYDGPMVNLSRSFVWAWDTRPYPWFPSNMTLWSDGPNYQLGHWINGRVSSRTLASVVAEICARAGVTDIDTTALHGIVRGFAIEETGTARQALQPLMLAHGFDAVERDGTLVFRNRTGRGAVTLSAEDLAVSGEIEADLVETRAAEAEMADRVRARFVLSDADFQIAQEEALLAGVGPHAVSETELAMSLTRAEGRQAVERWLGEAHLARDSLRFALPPSRSDLGAGDVVSLPAATGSILARIDRLETTELLLVEAVRIDDRVYTPATVDTVSASVAPVARSVPVTVHFLDLPLMRGDEAPHAPHLAVASRPWPGEVAVMDASTDADYRLNRLIETPATIGETLTELAVAPPGLVDRGAPLRIRLTGGALQSVSDAALLSGANLVAIGDGSAGGWELFQFRDAALVGPETWEIRHRLRGQCGTDALAAGSWPPGSRVVLLDGAPAQIDLAAAQRGQERHFRIGPARRPLDDAAYRHVAASFAGNGLRPYRPAHLRVADTGDALAFSWVRRTRIGGDAWDGLDVPLGEERESYLVRLRKDGALLRELLIGSPAFTYEDATQAADGVGGGFTFEVAQVSAIFGPGPFARLAVAP